MQDLPEDDAAAHVICKVRILAELTARTDEAFPARHTNRWHVHARAGCCAALARRRGCGAVAPCTPAEAVLARKHAWLAQKRATARAAQRRLQRLRRRGQTKRLRLRGLFHRQVYKLAAPKKATRYSQYAPSWAGWGMLVH